MVGNKFVAVLVVAFLIQIGGAQNFHYINEIQHGEEYMYNGSIRHLNSIPVVLGSLILGHCLKLIPALFVNYR
ncbi:hypothetical protein NQ318_022416 [Aromia moschata]|uniref:Uncharacterized protein n=1 Tax=Aromia moschata TaxID=1265417 RepID=A0AAV8Z4S0_9CUCU|nr:hypothetical protein NQ318_022416 [Aromia moschata]